MPKMCFCVEQPAYCNSLLAMWSISWRTGGLETDGPEGPVITVYPSVLKLVCIQMCDLHVAATMICTQPGWQRSMNCHAVGHPFAPLPPTPLLATPFSLQCHLPPVFLAHCPPDALPFVSAHKTGPFVFTNFLNRSNMFPL